MSEMEEKLNSVLNNPQMMQQIMAMAQALKHPSDDEQKPEQPGKQENSSVSLPFDPSLLQKLSGFASQGKIDRNQRALLNALCPYLSQDRIKRLEKAMQAARMAQFASSFLSQGGLSHMSGR